MNEKVLVGSLILLGVVCLVIIGIIGFHLGSLKSKISGSVIPFVLCKKTNGEYILASNSSYFCSYMGDHADDLVDYTNKEICKVYTGEKRKACEELTKIMRMRMLDCFKRLFTKRRIEINVNDVERNCKILTE